MNRYLRKMYLAIETLIAIFKLGDASRECWSFIPPFSCLKNERRRYPAGWKTEGQRGCKAGQTGRGGGGGYLM